MLASYALWPSVLADARSPGAAMTKLCESGTFRRVESFVSFTAIRTE
jgi:hypothetical protein